MFPSNQPIQPSFSLAARFAALATAVPWRRSAGLATLALGLAGLSSIAQAELLLYEGFNYASATYPAFTYLNGQTPPVVSGLSGNSGTSGSWTTYCNNVSPSTNGFRIEPTGPEVPGLSAVQAAFTQWYTGTSALLASSSGNYAGTGNWNNTPDHISAYITLDPSIPAQLGDPTKPTWLSCVALANHQRFPAFSLAIGAGRVASDLSGGGVGADANGNCVGVGSLASKYTDGTNSFGYATDFGANIWTNGANTVSLAGNSVDLVAPNAKWTRDNKPKVLIVKFVWGAALAGPHTMQVAAFDNTETLNEANFTARAVTNTFSFDPTTFTTLSVAGARYAVDEIRLATSFNTVIGGVDAAATGTFWAASPTGGGAGTWSASSNLWAANPGEQGTLAQSTSAGLSFAGTPGAVTVTGVVDAHSGLAFSVDGYQLTGGTLNLAGADTPTNTISVSTGTATAEIDSLVTGSHGLTKDGVGRLELTSTSNSYGGGTFLKAGTLQVAGPGSLGSASLTFEGGTLQYPAGAGATAIDVSGKIAAVLSGQVAKIDTNGYDVTFGTAIGGDGGLTKTGSGSLELTVTNGYTGPTLVSGGTLKVGASQSLTNLSVANGAAAAIHAAGVQTTTLDLNALSSSLDASANPLAVTTSAKLTGLTVTLTGGSHFSLSNQDGGDFVHPTLAQHRTLTANGGTLDLNTTGYDGVIGMGQGVGTLPTAYPAVFSGNGAWTVSGTNINSVGNVGLGQPDNHVWHYMALPTGDFDISGHVTGGSAGAIGIIARDNVNLSGGGNWAGIWANHISAYRDNGATLQSTAAGTGNWLRITRAGDLLTTFRSGDGTNWTPVQTHTYPYGQWGATTYLGLAISAVGVSPTVGTGTYDNVNFMGTATTPDLVSTHLDLTNGAILDLNFSKPVSIGGLAFGGAAQPGGTYGTSTTTPAPDYVDDIHFTGSGTLYVITTPTTPADPTATAGNDAIGLSWTAVTGATGYSVKRSETAGGPYTEIATPFTVSYTDKTVSNGTSYFYIVAATNTAGVSSYTAEVNATPAPLNPALSTVVASLAAVPADGSTPSTITVTLKDGLNLPVASKQVSLGQVSGSGSPVITPPWGITNGAGVVTFTVSSTTGGTDVFEATDVSDSSVIPQRATVAFEIVVGADYAAWAAGYLPADVSNPAADTDGDGLSNFQEYAFGLNPVSGASANPISVPLDKTNGTFTYTRRDPTLTGITYSVLTSTDLQTWSEDLGAIQTPGDVIADVQTVVVQVSAGLLKTPVWFIRVAALQP